MKKILWIASAILAAAAVSGCNELKEEFKDLAPQEISFKAGIGQYSTKVTDTAFEIGDKMGLFAGAPLNIVNEPLVWDGQKLVPGQKLYWGEGQTSKAKFRAYHPFNGELTTLDGKFPFPVKADQRERKHYVDSDLMFAQAEAAPQDGDVFLGFDHMLSKLVITVDNKSGDAIKDVFLSGLKTEAEIDGVEGKITSALGGAEDILYPAAVSVAGTAADMYAIIVPPQSARFGLAVVLSSGRTEVFSSEATMESGKQYRGSVEIAQQPVGEEVQFTVSVAPWEEGGSFSFKDPNTAVERTGWRMVYYPVGMQRVMEPMEQTLPGAFKYHFEDWREGDQFFLLSDNDNYIFGCNLAYPQQVWQNDNTWPVENGGAFSLTGFEGELNVWFYPDEGVLKYEPLYPEWVSIGEGEVVQDISYYLFDAAPFAARIEIYEDKNHSGVYSIYMPTDSDPERSQYNNIVIDARNPGKVWMRKCDYYPGWWENYNSDPFYLQSPVPENRIFDSGYSDEYIYGTLQNGIIRLGYLKKTGIYDQSEDIINPYYFQLVLPGYQRNPVFGLSLGSNFYGNQYEDGIMYQSLIVKPWPDVENLRYAVYAGKLSYSELQDAVEALKAGGGTPLDFTPGRDLEVTVPITKSGNYTFLFYADSPSLGSDYWAYEWRTFPVTVDGVYPDLSINFSGVKPHPVFPEKAAQVHVDCPNVSRVFVTAISKEAAQAAGLTEDDYYYYAYNNGSISYQGSFFSGVSGQDFVFTDLNPETEYIIIAAVQDDYGRTNWASTTVTTGSEPTSWETVGTGAWVDSTFMTGGYRKDVQILKASGTERYRAVQPYSDYWAALEASDPSAYEETYIGYSTDFDFFFKEDEGQSFIYYATYRSGRVEPGFGQGDGSEYGYLDFFHYNITEEHPARHPYIKYNCAVSEGVYNIAPYVRLHETNYYYPWLELWGGLTLVMPGYSYSPQAPVRSNCVELKQGGEMPPVVSAQHSVKPIKRHPINMGKAIVKTL